MRTGLSYPAHLACLTGSNHWLQEVSTSKQADKPAEYLKRLIDGFDPLSRGKASQQAYS